MRPNDQSKPLSRRGFLKRYLSVEKLEVRIVLDSGMGMDSFNSFDTSQLYNAASTSPADSVIGEYSDLYISTRGLVMASQTGMGQQTAGGSINKSSEDALVNDVAIWANSNVFSNITWRTDDEESELVQDDYDPIQNDENEGTQYPETSTLPPHLSLPPSKPNGTANGEIGSSGSGSSGSGSSGSGTAGSGTAGSGTAGSGTAGSGTAGSGTAGSGTVEEIVATPADDSGNSDGGAGAGTAFGGQYQLTAVGDRVVLGHEHQTAIAVMGNDIDPSVIRFTHLTGFASGKFVFKSDETIPIPRSNIVSIEDLRFRDLLTLNSLITTNAHKAVSEAEISGLSNPRYFGTTLHSFPKTGRKMLEWAVNQEDEDAPETLFWVSYSGGTLKLTNAYGETFYQNVQLDIGVTLPSSKNPDEPLRAIGSITIPGTDFWMELDPFNASKANSLISGKGLAYQHKPTLLEVNTQDNRFSVKNNILDYSPAGDHPLPKEISYSIMNQFAEVSNNTILISSADLVIYDSNRVALPARQETSPGMFMPRNDDDDNLNRIPDIAEANINGEDDLLMLVLTLKDPHVFEKDEAIYLDYDTNYVSIFTTPGKVDSHGTSTKVIPGKTDLKDVTQGRRTLWIEGVQWGKTDIRLNWRSNAYGTVLDLISVTVAGLDLDIDSDNSGKIDHSEWEEEIENHDFALGKLLVVRPTGGQVVLQNPKVPPIAPFTLEPLIISLPKNLPASFQVQILGATPIGKSPEIMLLDENKSHVYTGVARGLNKTFSLSQLNYNSSKGSITLYIQGLGSPVPYAKTDYDNQMKPDTRISAKLLWPTNASASKHDEAKIMVVEQDSYYYHLQGNSKIRYAGAAQAVYKDTPNINGGVNIYNAQNFALEYITQEEMTRFLNSDEFSLIDPPPGLTEDGVKGKILEYLYGKQNDSPVINIPKSTSFQAGLFRDYVTGKYILAFRGTEMGGFVAAFRDWLTNVEQAIFGNNQSYHEAAYLAEVLNSVSRFNGNLHLTGHSMGGGLASFASISTHVEATTFNPAGINPSMMDPNSNQRAIPYRPFGDPGALVDMVYVAFGKDNTNSNGVRIYNIPDPLTYYSDKYIELPSGVGNKIPVEGLFNVYPVHVIWTENPAIPVDLDNLTDEEFSKLVSEKILRYQWLSLVRSHGMDSIFFGLLHTSEETPNDSKWNAYNHSDPYDY